LLVVAGLGLVAAGCGDDDGAAGAGAEGTATVVVTTTILGDVVAELVGDAATVEVVMPPNVDPHDFAPSAQQAARLREADALVVNGLGFEEGLLDTIEGAEADGVAVISATDGVDLLEYGEAHDDDHGHEGDDPHFFSDPQRMAAAAQHLADELAEEVDGLDGDDFRQRVAAYVAELEALDAEVEGILDAVPDERRVLVTNHEVFGYFADRYGFEVLGVVIPGGSTLAEPSARDLGDLADEIAEVGVPAIFAEASSPSALADALADEGADVVVVDLFTESLGEDGSGAETYLDLVRTNAQRIAAALAG
jgi:zinc/manganese transport system substrate-binding protein